MPLPLVVSLEWMAGKTYLVAVVAMRAVEQEAIARVTNSTRSIDTTKFTLSNPTRTMVYRRFFTEWQQEQNYDFSFDNEMTNITRRIKVEHTKRYESTLKQTVICAILSIYLSLLSRMRLQLRKMRSISRSRLK